MRPSFLAGCSLLGLILAAATGTVAAREPEEGGRGGVPAGRTLLLVPGGHLFARYIADPNEPGFGLAAMSFARVDILDSGDLRSNLKLGGRFGVLRWGPSGRSWQLEIEAGFLGWFDVDRNYDNIGWDGIYGLYLTSAQGPRVALKLGARHISSHVGDEFEERTGRLRIDYTREEAVAALSWLATRRLRLYGEGGWAYVRRNEQLQQPARLQAGLEYVSEGSLWQGRLGWYAAADAAAWAEWDWEVGAAIGLGLLIPSEGRRWRLGVAYTDRHVPIGEFFQNEERWVTLGIWLDL